MEKEKYLYAINNETGEFEDCFVKELFEIMEKYRIKSITPLSLNARIEYGEEKVITNFEFQFFK